ncbi:protein of unknown function [Pseudomonas inefficax]|uniref:Uncharacterized protein n=1 Tax=Pseudomonas inefficax TaxID=2078786 RepID=A0AAQ1PBM4_9PSED|nr:protein of unknown function [Pseudomonas inefficax]
MSPLYWSTGQHSILIAKPQTAYFRENYPTIKMLAMTN